MFTDIAWAMGPAPAGGAQGQSGGGIVNLIFIFAMLGIFYFLIIRPQQKRAKEHQNLMNSLKKGDKVVTDSGILGLVEAVTDKTVVIKIAENTKVRFRKSAVVAIRESEDEE